MRVWMILGLLVAAGVVLVAFLDGEAILSAEEAATVVGGEVFPNSKCIVAGDCNGLNGAVTCPSPNGYCKECTNGILLIYGCRGGYPGSTCTYSGTVKCGELWEGTCNFNECQLMIPVGSCYDGRTCY